MRRAWFINGRFLVQPASGVQRYGLEVVRALDRHLAQGHPLSRDLDVELVAPRGAAPPGLRSIAFRTIGYGRGHIWEQAELARLARAGGLISLCNTGPIMQRKHIACLHDASTRVFPESYGLALRALCRVLHPAIGRNAARIATVSARLRRSRIVSPRDIPRNVVTLNSRVSLKDLDSGKRIVCTLADPSDLALFGDRLSVAATPGAALLGKRVGQIVRWPGGARTRRLRIEQVLYQPEAAGDFHL